MNNSALDVTAFLHEMLAVLNYMSYLLIVAAVIAALIMVARDTKNAARGVILVVAAVGMRLPVTLAPAVLGTDAEAGTGGSGTAFVWADWSAAHHCVAGEPFDGHASEDAIVTPMGHVIHGNLSEGQHRTWRCNNGLSLTVDADAEPTEDMLNAVAVADGQQH